MHNKTEKKNSQHTFGENVFTDPAVFAVALCRFLLRTYSTFLKFTRSTAVRELVEVGAYVIKRYQEKLRSLGSHAIGRAAVVHMYVCMYVYTYRYNVEGDGRKDSTVREIMAKLLNPMQSGELQ